MSFDKVFVVRVKSGSNFAHVRHTSITTIIHQTIDLIPKYFSTQHVKLIHVVTTEPFSNHFRCTHTCRSSGYERDSSSPKISLPY